MTAGMEIFCPVLGRILSNGHRLKNAKSADHMKTVKSIIYIGWLISNSVGRGAKRNQIGL
jgi:hypothetical protein